MPVLSWGHSQFWQGPHGPGEPPPAAGASGAGGYVPWQTSVIIGSMFGGLQPVWQWAVSIIVKKDKP